MTNISSILATAFSFGLLANAAEGPPLLDRVGRNVSVFWDRFSAVTCTETVAQKKLEPGGRLVAQKKAIYDYLILLQRNGEDLLVEESRVLQGKPGKENDRPLLTTSGFSALLLVLHPMFQPSFDFVVGPDEAVRGRMTHRIRFAHRKGERSPSVFQLHGRDYPIAWDGSAWIDRETFSVSRIEVNLQAPMEDIGLLRLSSDVHYAPYRAGDSVWMPSAATIEAATRRQRWHNSHVFTHYREFAVDTDVTVGAPKQ